MGMMTVVVELHLGRVKGNDGVVAMLRKTLKLPTILKHWHLRVRLDDDGGWLAFHIINVEVGEGGTVFARLGAEADSQVGSSWLSDLLLAQGWQDKATHGEPPTPFQLMAEAERESNADSN